MAVAKLGGGEAGAFEKFTAGVRHGEEAAIELAIYTDDPRWGQIGLLLKRLADTTDKMKFSRSMRRN